jgi:Phosphoinositide phospholipase C, Ca2+-dependent
MRRTATALITAALVLAACGGGSDGDTAPTDPSADTETTSTVPGTVAPAASAPTTSPATSSTEPARPLAINHMQVIGSHNSFHLKPQPVAFEAIASVSPELAESIEYSHRPLTEQLEQFGIRQFELDVFADPEGGLYSNRAANAVIGLDPIAPEPELRVPGYKVLHTQDFDYETTCLTLVACLTEIEAWSSEHPSHLPVMIMLEVKTQSVPEAAAADGLDLTIDLPWTVPVPITPELLDALDAEITSVFDPGQLITPDDVRAGAPTLEAAVLDTGWPSIDDSRGKVIFALNNTGDMRSLYTQGRPNLEGRPMFTSATPGDPDAAFVRFDDPNSPSIEEAARAGYLIRTRTDSPTADARNNDTDDRETAFASGAHFLSTDYYEPSEYFDSPYVVRFANGAVARCNPVTAPPTCSDDQLVE